VTLENYLRIVNISYPFVSTRRSIGHKKASLAGRRPFDFSPNHSKQVPIAPKPPTLQPPPAPLPALPLKRQTSSPVSYTAALFLPSPVALSLLQADE
jgi:hypothetical protein